MALAHSVRISEQRVARYKQRLSTSYLQFLDLWLECTSHFLDGRRMFLFVTQFLGEPGRVSHRLLSIVFGHLQFVAMILQVSLNITVPTVWSKTFFRQTTPNTVLRLDNYNICLGLVLLYVTRLHSDQTVSVAGVMVNNKHCGGAILLLKFFSYSEKKTTILASVFGW